MVSALVLYRLRSRRRRTSTIVDAGAHEAVVIDGGLRRAGAADEQRRDRARVGRPELPDR